MTTVTETRGTLYAAAVAIPLPVADAIRLDWPLIASKYADVQLPYAEDLTDDGKDQLGFAWCYGCHERQGSPFCCDQRASVVAAYWVHVGVVIEKAATLQQATPAQIVRRSPVNRAVA
jgi:hypothetical protein